jgi:hypothetical protein
MNVFFKLSLLGWHLGLGEVEQRESQRNIYYIYVVFVITISGNKIPY